jgi:putative tryptophan/tyrosine transport system substrate-binding protein
MISLSQTKAQLGVAMGKWQILHRPQVRIRRRELVAMIGGVAMTWPFVTRAQEKAVPVIGLLSPFSRADSEVWHQAFRQGLRDLGWVEGANIRIEYRYADGQDKRLPELVADLISLKVDIVVVTVTTDALPAAKATKTIPIVMASTGDPVGTGLIASLARPGGNVTGLTQIATDLVGKRLELLKEVAPGISRLAVFWDARDQVAKLSWQEMQLPARKLGMELHPLKVQRGGEFDAAFDSAVGAGDGALIALPSPLFVDGRQRIVDFAVAHRMPSIFHIPDFVRSGGLLSYGPDRADLFRRSASYVDKILKGAKPGDLPVEQPTKFQLVINLKTAKALGLTVPPTLLARADEVIE